MSQKIREIIIEKDTVLEVNKNLSVIEETYVTDGIRLHVIDSLNKIWSLATYKENQLNGDYFGFYSDVNMISEKGEYKENKKHGTWYFWNKSGVLLRKEVWLNDRLISKFIYEKVKK